MHQPDGPLEAAVRPMSPDELRRHGIALPPGAAEALREFARMPETRRGLRRLLGKGAEQAWSVELDPTKATRKGLDTGKLVLTKTKDSGQLIAQARDAKTGEIVENIRLKDAAKGGGVAKGAKVASGGAAVAWQAMAIATQQHYLVEISGRLGSIEQGVSDLRERSTAEKKADLAATNRALDLLQQHILNQHPPSENDRQNVINWHHDALSCQIAAVEAVERILNDDDGASGPRLG